MNPLWFATVLIGAAAFAQQPSRPLEGERAPRPESASNASVGGWCDALTGEKKEQCLRDERRKKEQGASGPALRGTCDALIGPEKESCLQQGGTVEVGAKATAGGTAGRAD
jgi:hypothetical protein